MWNTHKQKVEELQKEKGRINRMKQETEKVE